MASRHHQGLHQRKQTYQHSAIPSPTASTKSQFTCQSQGCISVHSPEEMQSHSMKIDSNKATSIADLKVFFQEGQSLSHSASGGDHSSTSNSSSCNDLKSNRGNTRMIKDRSKTPHPSHLDLQSQVDDHNNDFSTSAVDYNGKNTGHRMGSSTTPFASARTCIECHRELSSKQNLIVHMRIHTGEKPYSCDHCLKQFTTASYLSVHTRIHTNERPHACDQCEAKFTHLSSLKQHLSAHTGVRPFHCDQCPAKFTLRSNLTTHWRIHSGEKPFSCEICSYSCSTKVTLTVHMRKHTGETPYVCDQCSKRFTQCSSLVRHMRTHSGEKPFSCGICSEAFHRNGYLRRHIQRRHQ